MYKRQALNGQHSDLKQFETSHTSLLSRLVHLMRQLFKTVNLFAESYPYRADNELFTEKLCFNFHKQLDMSIRHYLDCLSLAAQISGCFGVNSYLLAQLSDLDDIKARGSQLLTRCDEFFQTDPATARETGDGKHLAGSEPKRATESTGDGYFGKGQAKIVNVIRTSRTTLIGGKKTKINVSNPNKKSAKKVIAVKQKAFDTISDSKPKQVARLFPNKSTAKPNVDKLAKKTMATTNQQRAESRAQQQRCQPVGKPRRVHSLESLNRNRVSTARSSANSKEHLLRLSDSYLNQSHLNANNSFELNNFYSPAFKHLSSPKLSKIGYSRSKSRSKSPAAPRSRSARSLSNERKSAAAAASRKVNFRNDDYDTLSLKSLSLRLKQESDLEDMRERYDLRSKFKMNSMENLSDEIRQQNSPKKSNLLFAYNGQPKTYNILKRLDVLKVNSLL
mgnify:CR=1 FL=1